MVKNQIYGFSAERNAWLKKERGISFEDVIFALENDGCLGTVENPGYPNQQIYIVRVKAYAYVVPFINREEIIQLKTVYPSRKLTKLYLSRMQ